MANRLIHLLSIIGLLAIQLTHSWPPSAWSQESVDPVVWQSQSSGVSASLRGLCVVNANTAWASGSGGTVLKTGDGGQTWINVSIADAKALDFRDVQAVDDQQCLVVSAGSPGCVYRTTDGGASWQCVYRDESPAIFFDAMAFWDLKNGLAVSDPQQGHLVLIGTEDGGVHWTSRSAKSSPQVEEGEAAFAASGTCLVAIEERYAWIGTGGRHPEGQLQLARVFASEDRGASWRVATTPIVASESAGIFSLAFANIDHGVAVGGDYQNPDGTDRIVAITDNGGSSWRSIEGDPPHGYRSGVAVLNLDRHAFFVAVGTNGSDVSGDWGNHWHSLGSLGFHAVGFSPHEGAGWAVGAEGRIAKWVGNDIIRKFVADQ